MESCDVLIEGGTIVDGSGAVGRAGSVAVRGDRISMLGAHARDRPATVGRTIDARGKVVSPGFIDLHSHAGLMILADPRHEPKVRQGVTTEVIGVDGLSYAPLPSQADLDALIEMNAGLDGAPEIGADWDSVVTYLDRFDGKVAVNIGLLIGNSALRISRLGWEDVAADERATADMRAMLREAMEAGALGLSSGLDYPPGAFATTDELAALTNEAARARRLLPHARSLPARRPLPRSVPRGDRDRSTWRGAGPHHPLLSPTDAPGRARTAPRPGRRRARRGPRRHVRHVPLRMGVDATAHPAAAVDPGGWPRTAEGATCRARRARAGARRSCARAAPPTPRRPAGPTCGWATSPRPANMRWEGRSLADVMAERGHGCGRRDVRPAARGGPARQPGHDGAVERDDAPLRRPSGRDVRHGLDVHRRQAVAADLWLVSARAGRVRPRPSAAGPRGGGAQDDVGTRRAARPDDRGCWRTGYGRRRRLRPGRSHQCNLRRAAPLPGRHRLRARQRAGRRRRRQHTGALPVAWSAAVRQP